MSILVYLFEDILMAILWEPIEAVAVVVFFANVVSIWLPNKSSYRPVQWMLDILNKLSMNILRNVNRHYPINDYIRPRSQRPETDGQPDSYPRADRTGGREP